MNMNDKTLSNNLSKEYQLCHCCEKLFERPHGKPRGSDFDRYCEKHCAGKACLDCKKVWKGGVGGVVKSYNDPENGEFRVTYIGCLECNPIMKKFSLVCEDCFYKEKRKQIIINQTRRKVEQEENDNQSKLIKENQELKQQLVEIQQELTKVLMKQAKQNNSRPELKRELIQIGEENQELITNKNNKNISADKVKEQFRKSQNLLKKANTSVENTNFSPQNKDNKIFNSFPYVIGGSVIFSLFLTFGYYLLRKNKEK